LPGFCWRWGFWSLGSASSGAGDVGRCARPL